MPRSLPQSLKKLAFSLDLAFLLEMILIQAGNMDHGMCQNYVKFLLFMPVQKALEA